MSDQKRSTALKGRRLDPVVVLKLMLKNWYIFIITLLVAIFLARFYISHTLPTYRVQTTMLIYEGDNQQLMAGEELLQGLGVQRGMTNIDNQIRILSSRAIVAEVLRRLPVTIEFYHRTSRNQIPIYPEVPVKINSENEIPLPKNTEFSIKYLGDNEFILISESEHFSFYQQSKFGDTIKIAGSSFWIEPGNLELFSINDEGKLHFYVNTFDNLVGHFGRRLNVELLSREGSILRISLVGPNYKRDADFLNKLTEVFQGLSLERKNNEAERRIEFINNQLVGITDSLDLTEDRLQQFRSSNRIMDVSAQGAALIGQLSELESERARLNLEANYYDYLSEYLVENETGESLIIPITMGIDDPGLTRLVTELAELQEQLSGQGASELNPIQSRIRQRVNSTKEALLETLNGLRRANSLARHENQEQINNINARAAALPGTERQLIGIERQFRLNDELYTFLLETKAEQQMQKASNTADSEVIDPADERFRSLVSPNTAKIYFIGLFLAFAGPMSIIIFNFFFNKKLKIEEIKEIINIPIVGNIPRSKDNSKTIMVDYPQSSNAEAFRLLRSKMEFFTKETKAPVIVVTSPTPGDGKTYTAINLASAYSMMGKKTILVGFDLRKPGIIDDFNLKNEHGVSTWLIGKSKLIDIVQKPSFENLFIITAGPVPPNPSELTALEKTQELMELLKQNYDIIVLDTSPIGFISDTYHLARNADACILVVRPGKTPRDMFNNTLGEMDANNIPGVSIVINDIKADNNQYSYGDKFGYTSDKKAKSRKKGRRREKKLQKV